jgi:hypothetical protein
MRRDIQALRGFSILVVLLYHSQFGWFKGGFLGVDIFFVISGFVITSKLMEGEGSTGAQIKEFYLRRAKRILPASLTVTVLTSIFAIFFLPSISRSRFSLEALSSALFSSNLHFARIGNDYLAQSSDPSPFLHYWSLGVEEQFYLLWPLLFLFFYKKNRNWLFPTLLSSAALGIWYTTIDPVYSFYLPVSRFWEFFAGILIAMNPQFSLNKKFQKFTALSGWALITLCVHFFSVNNLTPGTTTAIAIFGTMLVLAARFEIKPHYFLPKLGDYSFSLYLVHWPIVVYFLDRNSKLSSTNKISIILVSLLLSFSLTHFVERPFRFKKQFALSLPQWLVVILVGSVLSYGTLAASALTTAKIDRSIPITYSDGCHLGFGKTWPLHDCAYGDLASKTEIILAGDSHAAQWFPALVKIATERKWKLVNLTKSSCPATTLETQRSGKFDASCAIWQVKLITKINEDKPKFVIFSDYTEFQYDVLKKGTSYETAWRTGLNKFLPQIKVPFIFLGDTPKPSSVIGEFPVTRSLATIATEQSVKAHGGQYIDTVSWLCPSRCPTSFDGFNTYRDMSHISVHTSLALSAKVAALIPAK